ncbi:MAG: hypothetical protein OXQ29_02760, partial [Rhodospirillaceae bacterium]|nr:hypothetical protein [Rhodospirillaceae bacterium]
GRLLANHCDGWHSFEPVNGGPWMTDEGGLAAIEDPHTCAEGLLMDETGSHVYRVGGVRLETFAVEPEGGLRLVEEHSLRGGIPSFAMSNDGRHVYVATGPALWVFDRDQQTGMLSRNGFVHEVGTWYSDRPNPLAVSDDDAYLFLFRGGSNRAHVFSLENPSSPEHRAELSEFWDAEWGWERCGFADVRGDSATLDVLCSGLAITARWNPESGDLVGTDFVTPRTADRFNGAPMPEFDELRGVVATADDANLYVSTPAHGILVFSRVGGIDETD